MNKMYNVEKTRKFILCECNENRTLLKKIKTLIKLTNEFFFDSTLFSDAEFNHIIFNVYNEEYYTRNEYEKLNPIDISPTTIKNVSTYHVTFKKHSIIEQLQSFVEKELCYIYVFKQINSINPEKLAKYPRKYISNDRIKNISNCMYKMMFVSQEYLENQEVFEKVHDKILNLTLLKSEATLKTFSFLKVSSSKIKNKKSKKMTLYLNKANCCYISSLLSILFFSHNGHFISNMLCERINEINFSNLAKVCSQQSPLKTIDAVKEHSLKIQKLLHDMFFDLQRTKYHPCDLINELHTCDPRIQVGHFQNPGETYDLIANLFPSLLINFQRQESDGVFERELALFDTTDLPNLSNIMKSYPDHLVFLNGGIERIVHGLINWSERGFGEVININDQKYKLVGVIMHLSLSHYYSYFLTTEGESNDNESSLGSSLEAYGDWYHYDDMMSANPDYVEKLPNVFKDTRIEQPAMFFYVKV